MGCGQSKKNTGTNENSIKRVIKNKQAIMTKTIGLYVLTSVGEWMRLDNREDLADSIKSGAIAKLKEIVCKGKEAKANKFPYQDKETKANSCVSFLLTKEAYAPINPINDVTMRFMFAPPHKDWNQAENGLHFWYKSTSREISCDLIDKMQKLVETRPIASCLDASTDYYYNPDEDMLWTDGLDAFKEYLKQ